MRVTTSDLFLVIDACCLCHCRGWLYPILEVYGNRQLAKLHFLKMVRLCPTACYSSACMIIGLTPNPATRLAENDASMVAWFPIHAANQILDVFTSALWRKTMSKTDQMQHTCTKSFHVLWSSRPCSTPLDQ